MEIKVKKVCIIRRKHGTDIISMELEGAHCFPTMPECGCFVETKVTAGHAESWLSEMGFDSSIITLVVE